MIKVSFAIWFLLIISFLNVTVQGQDEEGTSKPKKDKTNNTSKNPRTGKEIIKTRPRPNPGNFPKAQKSERSPKIPKITTATFEVSSDQENSLITLSRVEDADEVLITSKTVNNVNSAVAFSSLDPGRYIVKISKRGFFDDEKNVVLKAGKNNPLNFSLKPSAGLLIITSETENAEIAIKNVGNFSGEFSDLVPAPQTYEISMSAEGHEPVERSVVVMPGQKTSINIDLKMIATGKLLQNARGNFQLARYGETLAVVRTILGQNADDPQANLLMGYAYFYSGHSRESRFYLSRALALQTEVEIPVKLFQKEKNTEILIDGILKLNRNVSNFISVKRPELNFSFVPASVSDLQFSQNKNPNKNDSLKPAFIEVKANFTGVKKSEKKTIRIYPRQAFSRVTTPGKAEVAACTVCADGVCSCQEEIGSVYELLLNWKSGTFPRPTNLYSGVMPSSGNFTRTSFRNISLSVPEDWQRLSENDNSVWFSPRGGFANIQNKNSFGYAVSLGVIPINNNDLKSESENFYRIILSGNNYLGQQGLPGEVFFGSRKGFKAVFAGFSAESGEEESVQIYTCFTGEGNLFYVLTVTPFNKKQEYRKIFNLIINSVRF